MTYRLLEPNPATSYTQRHTDDEPDQNQRKHCAEWHSTTRSLCPYEEVEEEEGAKDEPRNQQWSHDDVALPSLTAKGLVDSCRNVATNGTEKGRNQKDGGSQEATICR